MNTKYSRSSRNKQLYCPVTKALLHRRVKEGMETSGQKKLTAMVIYVHKGRGSVTVYVMLYIETQT